MSLMCATVTVPAEKSVLAVCDCAKKTKSLLRLCDSAKSKFNYETVTVKRCSSPSPEK